MEARQICSIYHLLLTIGNKFLKTFRASVLPCIYAPERLCARVSVRPCVCAPARLCAHPSMPQASVRSYKLCVYPTVCLFVCASVDLCARVSMHQCVCEPMHTSVLPYVRYVRSCVCALELLCARAFLCPSICQGFLFLFID